MPKILDPERQAQVAVKKYALAAASAVRAVTTEHTEGQEKHIASAIKAYARELIDSIKGSVP